MTKHEEIVMFDGPRPRPKKEKTDPILHRRSMFEKMIIHQKNLFLGLEKPKNKHDARWVLAVPGGKLYFIQPRYNGRRFKGFENVYFDAYSHDEVISIINEMTEASRQGLLDEVLEKTAKTERRNKKAT